MQNPKLKPILSSPRAKPMTLQRVTKNVRRSLNPEENGETLTNADIVAATGELRKKRADAVMNDKTPPVITTQVTSIAKESVSLVTPSPVITPLKQTETDTEGQKSSEKTLEPRRNQNGLGNDSTQQKMHEEENSECKSRKRKREQKQHLDLNETELSSDQSPNMMMNSAGVTCVGETPTTDTLMALPFAKKSPYWKRCESTEGYKSGPQRPHFSPLIEAKDDIPEWSAVGMMVTFYGLLEEVKDLKPDDSSSIFNSLSVYFTELEKHGFDITAPQSRISKVLSLKDEGAKKAEERKRFENKIEEEEKERRMLEEEMAELKRKILEMQRQGAVAKEKKEGADKRIVEMRSSAETIDQEIEDVKLEFQKMVLAPW